MIEVLVTVFVLATGLFGIAALQIFGVRYNHNAYLRSQSTALAGDLMDRMRANFTVAATTPNYFKNFGTDPPAATRDCSNATENCNPLDVSRYDLDEWFTSVTDVLPSADALVSAVDIAGASPIRVYTISLRWDNRRADNDAEPITFTYRGEL